MENISCDDHLLNIPKDVLIQILVLLPVLSLLRFKSVCKSWRALIQTSFFIDLHLNTTTTTTNNNFGTFIFQTSDCVSESREQHKNEAFMLSSSSSSSSSSAAAGGDGDDDDYELLKLEDLGFPPRYKLSSWCFTDHILMVGSCNGLICIHDTNRKEVSLWNPATRQFRILPKSIGASAESGVPVVNDFEKDFVAFGYDVKTKDYKVVQISSFNPYISCGYRYISVKDYIFRVQVYSLTTDSWRLLEEGIPNSFSAALPLHHGVCLKNGSYYFLGAHYNIDGSGETLMLLSFDFTKEIFTTIQQIPYAYDYLTSFGEKQLAVFAKIRVVKEDESDDFKTYDILVLNEHHGGGVKEEEEEEPSWTKLHSMRLIGNYTGRTPRCISNNGEFALISTCDDRVINGVHVSRCHLLQLFNLVTQEVKKEFRAGRVIRAEVYKQSLVTIGRNDTTTDRVIGVEM